MAEEIEMIPHTDEAWEAEMEKVEASPAAMAKKIFILTKSAFVIYQTMKAAIAWKRSKKPMATPAMLVLTLSALIVGGVCAYKFTSKNVRPLASLQCVSHYLAFCILHVLIGYADAKNFQARSKILNHFYVIHLVWLGLIVFTTQTAGCTKEDFYPINFVLNDGFSFVVFAMVYMLHNKGYYIEWGKDEEESKKLFIAQTDRYIGSYTFLVQWHIFELVLGKGLDSFTEAVMCADDGNKWLFASAKGNLFMMLHIIGTMMGTGMARAVFIKTAKAEGFFGGCEDTDDEDDKAAVDSKKDK